MFIYWHRRGVQLQRFLSRDFEYDENKHYDTTGMCLPKVTPKNNINYYSFPILDPKSLYATPIEGQLVIVTSAPFGTQVYIKYGKLNLQKVSILPDFNLLNTVGIGEYTRSKGMYNHDCWRSYTTGTS